MGGPGWLCLQHSWVLPTQDDVCVSVGVSLGFRLSRPLTHRISHLCFPLGIGEPLAASSSLLSGTKTQSLTARLHREALISVGWVTAHPGTNQAGGWCSLIGQQDQRPPLALGWEPSDEVGLGRKTPGGQAVG